MLKKDISHIHQNMYKHIKKKALSYEGKPSKELKRYQDDQGYYTNREFRSSTLNEILNSITNSSFIYLGDFHTFDQNQRTMFRIMRSLHNNKENFIIALEMIHTKHQEKIDAYLNDFITELEFLEMVEYSESWRFPWNHYKLLFDFASENNIKIIALNTKGSLKERDKFAADILVKQQKQAPLVPILILYGELHIMPNKLPKEVLLKCPSHLRQTIIHQNIDDIYWRQKIKRTSEKIVKFNDNEFCIQTSPPWIKYESMVYWFESLIEDPEFEIHEYIIETGLKIFGSNTYDNFINICNEIITNLELDLDKDDVEDFNLYDHSHLEYVEGRIDEIEVKKLKLYYKELVEVNESFKLPKATVYYCSNYSINKIAYIAGVHIHNIYLKNSGIRPNNILTSRKNDQKFILFVYEHMFAYFFSKIFNPHRKCDLYIDIKQKMVDKNVSKREIEHHQFCLDIIDDKIDISTAVQGISLKKLYLAGKTIGQFMGDYFYEYINNPQNKITKHILEEEFLSVKINKGYFKSLKKKLLNGETYRMQKKRFF